MGWITRLLVLGHDFLRRRILEGIDVRDAEIQEPTPPPQIQQSKDTGIPSTCTFLQGNPGAQKACNQILAALNWMECHAEKLPDDAEFLARLPMHTVLLDKDGVPCRVVSIQAKKNFKEELTAEIRVRTIAGNLTRTMVRVPGPLINDYKIIRNGSFVSTADLISGNNSDLEDPNNFKLFLSPLLEKVSVGREASSVLLNREAEKYQYKETLRDFSVELKTMGAEWLKVNDPRALATLPMYTMVYSIENNSYGRVVRVVSDTGFFTVYVRSMRSNDSLGTISERWDSYTKWEIAIAGDYYVVAPPIATTPMALSSVNNFRLEKEKPFNRTGQFDISSPLETKAGGSYHYTPPPSSAYFSRGPVTVYQQAARFETTPKPVFRVFDEKRKLIGGAPVD